ncbi:hypothetical protein [Isoptericola rhizosphaerae]|uniref:hypothetical protein n=1 Tax=Isoptericola rhizosphaerae TaxID=3377837 RepID=UPI00383BC252
MAPAARATACGRRCAESVETFSVPGGGLEAIDPGARADVELLHGKQLQRAVARGLLAPVGGADTVGIRTAAGIVAARVAPPFGADDEAVHAPVTRWRSPTRARCHTSAATRGGTNRNATM